MESEQLFSDSALKSALYLNMVMSGVQIPVQDLATKLQFADTRAGKGHWKYGARDWEEVFLVTAGTEKRRGASKICGIVLAELGWKRGEGHQKYGALD
eukprot:scaffold3437_cov113-Cylindrotheca_fusiformis.AAC.32